MCWERRLRNGEEKKRPSAAWELVQRLKGARSYCDDTTASGGKA